MANVLVNTLLINSNIVKVLYFTLQSDGTNETDYVLYDSSLLNISDPLDSTLLEVQGVVSTQSTARVRLEWDATEDVLAFAVPLTIPFQFDFKSIGGLTNTAGAGKTGDLTLTTTGLNSGDSIVLILKIRNN